MLRTELVSGEHRSSTYLTHPARLRIFAREIGEFGPNHPIPRLWFMVDAFPEAPPTCEPERQADHVIMLGNNWKLSNLDPR